MTPGDGGTRERRAAGREQRRSATQGPAREQDGDAGNGVNGRPAALAGDALKAAASAAAVGAAVGVARALSARRRHDDDEEHEEPETEAAVHEEPDQQEEHEEQEQHEPDEPDEPAEPASSHEPESRDEPEPEPEEDAPAEPASPSELQAIVRQARELLRELHGTDAESVSSVGRTARGWAVGLEVVEMRRIPDSTDVLATYEVELDGDGGILRFERTRRYNRAEAGREGR